MFGYVRPALNKLEEEDKDRFQAAYCGLCHTLGKRYGFSARLFLNYDLAFLAMLLGPVCDSSKKPCFMHPFKKRHCACRSVSLDTAADMSVILLWWQIQDGIADSGLWKSLKYRVAACVLKRAYRKASSLQPDFDGNTRAMLNELSVLEKERCASVDRPADCFARLLAQASCREHDQIRRRILEQMLYHLGRWIYLVDAADDLKKDIEQGNYNPVSLRYSHENGVLTQQGREELGQTLDQSVRLMAAAFELSDFGDYQKVVESVVYAGLYLVGAAVLDGTFHKQPARVKQ
jgi:hypothetical protein